MPYNTASRLWNEVGIKEKFFQDKKFKVKKQIGPHCVSTVLGVLTGYSPKTFQGRVNTQDPVSWSYALQPWGMKLAYCSTDVRKLRYYMNELVELDDLFTLSYYTQQEPWEILGEPDSLGWVTGSHIVIMHQDKILDTQTGKMVKAVEHSCNGYHTKRIFRVVPINHTRGI